MTARKSKLSHKTMFDEGLALGLYDMMRDEWIFYVHGKETRTKTPPKTWTDKRARYFHICKAQDLARP